MKKDEALQRRERLVKTLNQGLVEVHLSPLEDDGKLYHEEIDGENRWAVRLSRPGLWPHVPPAKEQTALPGLRYEVWLFQKREQAWIGLLNGTRGPAAPLAEQLRPWWREWVESGKYARRYQPIDAVWQRVYPETAGIWRALPLDDKLDRGLLMLVRDTLPGVEKAIEAAGPAEELVRAFRGAAAARDPLAELLVKFGKGR